MKDVPSTSSLMEPKEGRRRLLDLEPSRVSHEAGDEPRDWGDSLDGVVVKRGGVGFGWRIEEAGEAMATEGPSIKGPKFTD